MRLENYQIIDDSITGVDRPYRKLPQVAIRGFSPSGLLGMKYLLETDATYFDRGVGVTGIRGRISPEVGLPIRTKFVDMEPAVAVDYTRYRLRNTAPGDPEDPDRVLPIASFDVKVYSNASPIDVSGCKHSNPACCIPTYPFEIRTICRFSTR